MFNEAAISKPGSSQDRYAEAERKLKENMEPYCKGFAEMMDRSIFENILNIAKVLKVNIYQDRVLAAMEEMKKIEIKDQKEASDINKKYTELLEASKKANEALLSFEMEELGMHKENK